MIKLREEIFDNFKLRILLLYISGFYINISIAEREYLCVIFIYIFIHIYLLNPLKKKVYLHVLSKEIS